MTHMAQELGISHVMMGKKCEEQLVPKLHDAIGLIEGLPYIDISTKE